MKSYDIVQFTIRNVDEAHCIYICLLDYLSALHGTVLTQGTIYMVNDSLFRYSNDLSLTHTLHHLFLTRGDFHRYALDTVNQ